MQCLKAVAVSSQAFLLSSKSILQFWFAKIFFFLNKLTIMMNLYNIFALESPKNVIFFSKHGFKIHVTMVCQSLFTRQQLLLHKWYAINYCINYY